MRLYTYVTGFGSELSGHYFLLRVQVGGGQHFQKKLLLLLFGGEGQLLFLHAGQLRDHLEIIAIVNQSHLRKASDSSSSLKVTPPPTPEQ